jgi:putative membrane protein
MTETAGKRDNLAMERTHLANERTLLAYVRTALSMLGGGAVVLHFFPVDPVAIAIGWFLVGAGAVVLLLGVYRFFRVGKRLRG